MNDNPSNTNVENRCRAELKDYIEKLDKKYLKWYENEAHTQYQLWFSCFWVSIIAGFASSLVAALIKGGKFTEYGPTIIIVLPALGSLAGIILSQFHFRELEDLRERGRIDFQDIIDWARGQFAAAESEQKCLAVYEELRKKVTELEMAQHQEFTGITSQQKPSKTSKT